MAPSRPAPSIQRRLLFALLYFCEGAPIGYIWWAMPTRLRAAGMPVEQVAALTAMLTLPWALKFLWAPAVDALRGRRWGYRSWITTAQALMGLALLPLGFAPLEEMVGFVTWLLLAHAVFAATQDVAIDALAISIVPEGEHARVTGWMQAGMLTGRAIFGGLALAAERWIGAEAVVLVLLGCVWSTMVVVWVMPCAVVDAQMREAAPRRFVRSLARALANRSTWLGLGVALTAGAGFEAVGGLIGPFLLDRGATTEQVGWFFALPVIACMIIGAIAGGWAADRLGHKRMLAASIVAVALAVGGLLATDAAGVRGAGLMTAATPIYLFTGALTASSYALFMDLTDPAIGGTQFSAFMGATNMCEVWSVAAAGAVAGRSGYAAGFLLAAGASLVALAILPMLRRARPGTSIVEAPSASGGDGCC